MTKVHDKFIAALKTRLNGRLESAEAAPDSLSTPAQARAARVYEAAVAAATADAVGLPFAEDLAGRCVSQELLSAVPIVFARRHGLVGLAGANGSMPVALSDLAQWPHLQTLGKVLGRRIEPLFVPRREILRAINAAYQQQGGGAERMIEQLNGDQVMRDLRQAANEDLLDAAGRAPVI